VPASRVPSLTGPEDGTGGAMRDACTALYGPSDDIGVVQAGPARGNINLVYHTGGRISRVLDRDIGIAVRWGATLDNLIPKGYTLNHISSHSLRAGGAMAMKLSGMSDSTIMRVGRWSSLTYLTYIHSQIGALTAGVAWKMSTAFTFQNVG